MKKLQRILMEKEHVCDNVECQTLIIKGELAIVEYKSKYFGGNRYYHNNERCTPTK